MKKTFPEFLATPIKNNPDAKKIFPVIGLKDKSIKLKVNKKVLDDNFRKELVHYLSAFLSQSFSYSVHNVNGDFVQLAKQIKEELSNCVSFSKDLKKKISELRKLNKSLQPHVRIWWLEETFKTYHHLSKSNLKICFSTKQWDLATISMRGIKSCQSWDSHQHNKYLQGTILDPFVGVVYITDGKNTSHGKKMLFRALVRFVLTYDNYKLFVEPVYHPSNYTANRPIYNHPGYYSTYFYNTTREHNLMVRDVFKNLFKIQKPIFGYVSGDGYRFATPRSRFENNIHGSLSDTGTQKCIYTKNTLKTFKFLTPAIHNFMDEVLL